MTASHVHDVAPDTVIAVRNGARLTGRILCRPPLPGSSWPFGSACTNTFTAKVV